MQREINPFQHKSTPEFKQTTYQVGVAKKLLTHLAKAQGIRVPPFQWTEDDGRPPMHYLMQTMSGFPVMLNAVRPTQVTLHQLIGSRFTSLEIWKEFERMRATYTRHDSHGVVFDVHGDGIPDLVLHNWGSWPVQSEEFTICRSVNGISLYICPFSAFLNYVSQIYRFQL